jgi:uncharacterized membrane protein YhaH (DUF805 family)
MFKNIFSFNGRIRRTEYGISLIIYFVCYLIIELLANGVSGNKIFFLFLIPVIWFIWAQGAKRCHDIGKSGWWQIIPFYGLWMLFENGMIGINEYGENPKSNPGYDSSTYVDPYPVYDSGVIPVYDDGVPVYDDGPMPDQDVIDDDQNNVNDDASFNNDDDDSF